MRVLLLFLVYFLSGISAAKRPNIVVILTDDQDVESFRVMEKTQKLMVDYGVTFENAFANTPVCCPSRATILTGQYQHNTRTLNNSANGGCYNEFWQESKEPYAYPVFLQAAGYKTFYSGKYLNEYGFASSVVPPGWDSWAGLVGNSVYYNYRLVINGTYKSFGDRPKDYLTNVIEKYGLQFLDSVGRSKDPFLMVLATPAAHGPFTPEPKYEGVFNGTKAPRTPNFNIKIGEDKHWLLRLGDSPLPRSTIHFVDDVYRRRLETLLTVDDMVEKVIKKLKELNQLDNTVIIFTSDHGYHTGQFSLPIDKRQPYEFDIRVPFIVRGPNIKSKTVVSSTVLHIDLAPTILDIAGVSIPKFMDGKSWLPLATKKEREMSARGFLIEYHGEGNNFTNEAVCFDQEDSRNLFQCRVDTDCKCQDSKNNTYTCLRYLSECDDFIYCEFDDDQNFVEYYDLTSDYYELQNLAYNMSDRHHGNYRKAIKTLKRCAGPDCNDPVL